MINMGFALGAIIDFQANPPSSVLIFSTRCTRPGFTQYQRHRFEVPAGNLQPRLRTNRVLIREAGLDSSFLSGQQRDVIIFPKHRQYLFGRLPRFYRKVHLECQRR